MVLLITLSVLLPPAGERRIYNGVSGAQYCLAGCTVAISEFIQGGQGHRVNLLDHGATKFVYSLYVNQFLGPRDITNRRQYLKLGFEAKTQACCNDLVSLSTIV